MAVPNELAGKVLVILTIVAVDSASPANCVTSKRVIELASENTSIIVGRASKTTSKGFVAHVGNAWFVSEVMSRRHAEITADLREQKVKIRDLSSLHGTYLNDEVEKISHSEPRELKNGDTIKFGVAVWRDNKSFTPTTVKVGFIFDQREISPATTFRVPEGSEDGSDVEVDYSSDSGASRRKGDTEPTVTMPARRIIDLTGPDDLEIINLSSAPPSPAALSDDENDPESIPENEVGCIDDMPSSMTSGFGVGTPGDLHHGDMEEDMHYDDMYDYAEDRSFRASTDENDGASIDSDPESYSSRSDDGDTRSFEGDASNASDLSDNSRLDQDDMSEMGKEDISVRGTSHAAGAAWSPYAPSDEELYDSSDVDAPRDPFWDPKHHGSISMSEYPPTVSPSFSNAPEKLATQTASSNIPLKTTVPLTIVGMLNDDKSATSSLRPATYSSSPSDLLSPALANQIPTAALARRPSPSDVIIPMSSFVGSSEPGLQMSTGAEVSGLKSGKAEHPAAQEENKMSAAAASLKHTDATSHQPHNQPLAFLPAAFLPPLEQNTNSGLAMTNSPWTPEARLYADEGRDASRRTRVGISDIVEAGSCKQVADKAADKITGKRKAQDISVLSEMESSWEQRYRKAEAVPPLSPASSHEVELSSTNPSMPQGLSLAPVLEKEAPSKGSLLEASQVDIPAVAMSQSPDERQPKRIRLRHIAERVGYAALGGVTAGAMIVGTLIYTSPTFT